eukprot:scaffold148385_cov43-Tisochrysis_lutea.AAC.1
MLKEYFNGKEPNKGINPDESVAYGAAVQHTGAPMQLMPPVSGHNRGRKRTTSGLPSAHPLYL